MAWELTGNADATAASFLGSTNAQPLIVRAGTTPSATPPERLRILPDGKIGIGTTTPQARLSVSGGGATLNGVAVGTDTSAVGYHNEHETVGVTNSSYTLRLQSPSGLVIHTGATGATLSDNERMAITPDGNVGVGMAPGATYKLDVAGAINATDVHKNGTPLVSSQWAEAAGGISYALGNVGVGKAPTASYRLDVGGVLNASDVHKNGAPLVSSQWAGAAGGVISYGGGNVGIGTTTPQGKLQVSGGAIMPAIGNSPTAGIQFPSDPGGGAQDQAFIRYFAESGETTKLLIGCQNDPDDRISFYQFGAERLTIFNGNVGVGTTSPGAKLEVNGDVALMGKHALRGNDDWLPLNQDGAFKAGVHTPGVFAPVSLNVGGLGGWGNPGWGNAWVAGSIGIGTTTPQYALHLKTGWGILGLDTQGVNQHSGIRLHENGTVKWHIWNNGSAGGNLLSINSETGQGISVSQNGDVRLGARLGTYGWSPTPRTPGWGGGIHTWDVEAEGTMWSQHGYKQGSDARTKTNVAELSGVLEKLEAIRGVSFERSGTGAPAARRALRDIGVIAQEVEEVFPELVSEHGEDNLKAVNYSGLAGVLIEAAKELKAENVTLRTRIEALERN